MEEVPLILSFKNLAHSDAVSAYIRKLVNRLQKYYSRITSCHVVVAVPHRHHHKGNLYEVHIDLKIPGDEFVVKQHQKLAASHKDIYVAAHEAFDCAKRFLDDHKQKLRGQIKTSVAPEYPVGRVIRLLKTLEDEGDYGFLQTEDGKEVYFHRNTVQGKHYDLLEVGSWVRFTEELGDLGPQASLIIPLERNLKAS